MDRLYFYLLSMIIDHLDIPTIKILGMTCKKINKNIKKKFIKPLTYVNYPCLYFNSEKNNYLWAISNGLKNADEGIIKFLNKAPNFRIKTIILNLFRSKNIEFVKKVLPILDVEIELYIDLIFKSGFVDLMINPSIIGINRKINYNTYQYKIYKYNVTDLYDKISDVRNTFRKYGIIRRGDPTAIDWLLDTYDIFCGLYAYKSGSEEMIKLYPTYDYRNDHKYITLKDDPKLTGDRFNKNFCKYNAFNIINHLKKKLKWNPYCMYCKRYLSGHNY